jgi:hypothetical protein
MVHVEATSSTQRFGASEIPINSVVIFNDSAQIKRDFGVTLKAGLNEIVIEVDFKLIL